MLEKKELLGKIDDSKRDFVKKLAIGSAYALPVMASFPLDSVRKSARAQGVYGDPAVVTVEGRASTDFDPGAGQVGAADPRYTAYWVITFDRPMNRNFKDAIYYDGGGSDNCGEAEPRAAAEKCPDLGGVDKCGDGDNWSWTKDGTQLYMGFSACQGDGQEILLVLNPKGSCKATPFQDMESNRLARTEGCARYCEERDLCA